MSVYLVWGLAVSFTGLFAATIFPRHRRIALLAGLFAAPLGLLDIVFAPEYWAPPHIFGSYFSIEGMLFSFGNGVLFWLAAIIPFWRRITYNITWRNMVLRCLMCWLVGALVVVLVWSGGLGIAGFDIMNSAFVALIVTGIFIVSRRPDIWPLVITGSVGGGLFYLLEMYIISVLYPDFANVWAPQVIEGYKIFGYPIEEYVWALVYSGVWAPAVAYGCNVYISKPMGVGRRI